MRLNFLITNVLIFLNINVIAFKIIPLGRNTLIQTLFPLLEAALEVINRYVLQHVHYTLLNVFLSLEMTFFEEQILYGRFPFCQKIK